MRLLFQVKGAMLTKEHQANLIPTERKDEMNMEKNNTLLAGYGRVDVTPDWEVGLTGYQNSERRKTTMVLDPVYVTCIAVRSGETTALLYTVDFTSICEPHNDKIRSMVEKELGIPGDYVYVSATHTHSSPERSGDVEKLFYEGALKAAKEAVADLAPAKVMVGTKEIPGMNFVRHYLMEDGTYSGSNFGDHSLKIVDHATAGDPRMILVRFVREPKPDILMMNWQAHNDNAHAVGFHNISSSYTGRIRAYLEKDTGMHFAYFCGAGGNQNPESRIPEEKHGLNWLQYARKLSDYALEMLADLKPVNGTEIKGVRLMYTHRTNHDWDHMEKEAKEVMKLWKETNSAAEATKLARTFGLSSVYHANVLLRKINTPKTDQLELCAFRIGDLGFITGTVEMFSNTGLYVRANSPFETTFILTGNSGYLPPVEAYDYRSYEADTAYFARGTQEEVAPVYIELLNQIK